MLKSHPLDSDQATKMCRSTTLTEKQMKELYDEEVDVFTDVYSNKVQRRLNKNKEMTPPLQEFLK